MKRLRRFKEVISTDKDLKESSLFGKGVAITQNRFHAATKTKYINSLSQIQSDVPPVF